MNEQNGVRNALLATAIFLVLIWSVHVLVDLGGFKNWRGNGVHPRDWSRIWGIFTMPFLHAKGFLVGEDAMGFTKTSHIFNNSASFLVLNSILFFFYHKVAIKTWSVIFLFSGLFVWLIGQDGSNHIGASGVVYGLAFFVFTAGVLKKDNVLLLRLSMLVAFLYGGIVWGIFPIQVGVSWEGHLGGAIAGVFCAYYFRDQLPKRAKYRYELEEELERLQSQNPRNKKPNGKTPIVQIYRQFRHRGMDRGF